MSNLQFANNATAPLAAALTSTATTVYLAAGTGSVFPALSAGQFFFATILDSASRTIMEIVKVTARTGDTLTVVRAQEGTTANAYLSGDLFNQFLTAATANAFAQVDGSNQFAADISGASGSIIASLSPTPADVTPGMVARVQLARAIAPGTTMNLNGSGVYPVVGPDGATFTTPILGAGVIAEFAFTGTTWQLLGGYLTPAQASAVYAPINSPTFTGTVTIPSGANIAGYALLASPTFTGTPAVPTAAPGTSTTQAASTAFVTNAIATAGQSFSSINAYSLNTTLTSANAGGLAYAPPGSSGPFYTLPTSASIPAGEAITVADYGSAGAVVVQAAGSDVFYGGTHGANNVTVYPGLSATFVSGGSANIWYVVADPSYIYTSPAFNGTPTVPTAPVNTSTTQAASTAFANPWSLLANPGGFEAPSGYKVQQGVTDTSSTASGAYVDVTLPQAYSNTEYSVSPSVLNFTPGSGQPVPFLGVNNKTVSGFRIYSTKSTDSSPQGPIGVSWITVGY